MQVWHGLAAAPDPPAPAVVTLGNFDGVHLGHQAVLDRVVARARADGLKAVAITFDPHPAAVHHPDRPLPLITALPDRLDLMAERGLDATLVIDYTPAFAALSPADFARRVLVDGLAARAVVVGRDIRFGARNAGDLQTLSSLGAELGFDVEAIADLGAADAGGRPRWSSTAIRELLAAGDVAEAARLLGRPHRLTGTVVHGDHRGRELGFPTANLGPDALGLVPADGVYAGWLVRLGMDPEAAGSRLPVAISIGTNPTFDVGERRVEANVPGRDDLDLYGERIRLDFVEHLRHTLAFHSAAALVGQMREDVAAAVQALRRAG